MTKVTADNARALGLVPYLSALPAAERERLSAHCEVRVIEPGARAFEEGDAPAGVFVILEGRVRISRSSSAGREQVLHEEGPGATLAEVPVFDGQGYIGSAIATTAARLLFVPRAPLLAALSRHPAAASEVIRILAARVRRFAALAGALTLDSVDTRIARDLLRRAGPDGTVELPPTRDQWAAELGTVREQVSRALSRLQRTGAVTVERRTVTIQDRKRLDPSG